MHPGDTDLAAAAAELARRLPAPLEPLARIAFDYRWSWDPDGASVFSAVEPDRWERVGHNPVQLLITTTSARLEAVAADAGIVERADRLAALLEAERASASTDPPVAFFSAEFGVHSSLPVYSGGLGVLAGDIVKEASDLALPLVAVGLFYRTGYFHQRIDLGGLQHEYWIDADPAILPIAYVRDGEGRPVEVIVPIDDEDVIVRVWRVAVGRVPLYLLDTDVPGNSTVARWITSRLYEGSRTVRLAQYAVLGAGGAKVLAALGIRPARYHLNEGHPALAAVELVARARDGGAGWEEAWESVRRQVVFTTHTPVPAGNETYGADEIRSVLGRLVATTGDPDRVIAAGRIHPEDGAEPSGMTVLALRASHRANGVSRRHGEVAREMWRPLHPGAAVQDVPIGHVTNGVHVPTWLGPSMRGLLDHHLGEGWMARADDPATWAPVDDIPDADLWAARTDARRRLIELVRRRATEDRLRRGEESSYVAAVAEGFDPDRLTIGFARRLATYKRLYLLSLEPERAVALLDGDRPVQFLFAGKAHPLDDQAKRIVADLFRLKSAPAVAGRVAFLEDYDLGIAGEVVAGCDVWVNVPRPPLEASGTSGMKSCLNGGIQLSVLDGWWAEAFDGTNGWAIDGSSDPDEAGQDRRHAGELFDRLEQDVVPLFHDRDASRIPVRWLAMVRASLRTNGPRFSATRMVREYASRVYA